MKLLPILLTLAFALLALPASAADPYAHTNSKGKTYYLFSKDVPLKNSEKVQTIYYFAKDPKNPKGNPLEKVPEGKIVSETKTGLLVLKKDPKAAAPAAPAKKPAAKK